VKRVTAGGGFPAIFYLLRKARSSGGYRAMYRAMRSRNACKTCALGMGGQAGGMVNEAGHFPERYQVAVLDYHLPELNGLEVARRLKRFQPDCRILMISSELPNLAALADQEVVVDRFLAKPFSKDAILEVIAQLCPSPVP